MTNVIDMFGRKCSRLRVLGLEHIRGAHRYWRCRCECGKFAVVAGHHLRNGNVRSCGCLLRETVRLPRLNSRRAGGASLHPLYDLYRAMVARCYNPNAVSYEHYGARGITVCPRWLANFSDFIADVGKRPVGHTLDRIDNARGYEPGNVRWATPKAQSNHKTVNRRITILGETKNVSEWAEDPQCAVSRRTLYARLDYGWDPAIAVFLPLTRKKTA